MSRALRLLPAAAWWGALAACLVWWAPSLALMAARLLLDRARFRLALGLGRTLVAVGLPAAAARVFAVEAERAGRRMRAIQRRRG